MRAAGPIKNSYQTVSGRSYQSCVVITKTGRLVVNSITKQYVQEP